MLNMKNGFVPPEHDRQCFFSHMKQFKYQIRQPWFFLCLCLFFAFSCSSRCVRVNVQCVFDNTLYLIQQTKNRIGGWSPRTLDKNTSSTESTHIRRHKRGVYFTYCAIHFDGLCSLRRIGFCCSSVYIWYKTVCIEHFIRAGVFCTLQVYHYSV